MAPGGNRGNDFLTTPDGTDGRPGLTKTAYDWFRPNEAVPIQIKPIIKRAEQVYQKVGLVKNVIDLMGDFASQELGLFTKTQRLKPFIETGLKKLMERS